MKYYQIIIMKKMMNKYFKYKNFIYFLKDLINYLYIYEEIDLK